MVDTSQVLERAISALKRSQRFRAVTDEVREAERLDKERQEKQKYMKTHTLRHLTEEDIDRILGRRSKSVDKSGENESSLSSNPLNTRIYPKVMAAKPVFSGSSTNASTISSPSPSQSKSKTLAKSDSHASKSKKSLASANTPSLPQELSQQLSSIVEPMTDEGSGLSGSQTQHRSGPVKPGRRARPVPEDEVRESKRIDKEKQKYVKTRTLRQEDKHGARSQAGGSIKSGENDGSSSKRHYRKVNKPAFSGSTKTSTISDSSPKTITKSYSSRSRSESQNPQKASASVNTSHQMTSTIRTFQSDEHSPVNSKRIYPKFKAANAKPGPSGSSTNTSTMSFESNESSQGSEPKTVTKSDSVDSRSRGQNTKSKKSSPSANIPRISPELSQQLSSIVENLQSMTMTSGSRPSSSSRRHHYKKETTRTTDDEDPTHSYTQDFLSDDEEEVIQELKNIRLNSRIVLEKSKTEQLQQQEYWDENLKALKQSKTKGNEAASKILAFPPGIEPNAENINYILEHIPKLSPGFPRNVHPKNDFYSKFLGQVVDSNERMYNATVAVAKDMGKLYHQMKKVKTADAALKKHVHKGNAANKVKSKSRKTKDQ